MSCVLKLLKFSGQMTGFTMKAYKCNPRPLLPFRFPLSKPQLSSKWVQSLGMKNFVPTSNTCLCSEHFRPECFRDYKGKQFLREDAVPTLLTNGNDSLKVGCHTISCFFFFLHYYQNYYFYSLPFATSRKITNDSMFSRLNCAKEWCCQKRPP